MELRWYIHAQNTGTTADIEDDLVLEDVAVLVNGVAVRAGANIVFLKQNSSQSENVIRREHVISTYQHLLVNTCVGAKIRY